MEVNTNVVRWGVLSTTKTAQEFVLSALKQAENAEIAAIASSNPAVNQVASTFGISTMYKTYEE
jgi:D-xylose 1-dehydrogenase (NADP+, D-xylono-1,5-lactone-forming)